MSQSTFILLILLVVIVALGAVYVLRPEPLVNLSVNQKATPTPTPIDNTMQLGATPGPPEGVEPINKVVKATIKTNKGDIVIDLGGPHAPLTVGNFIKLAQEDFYDGTTFHRIIPDFMIQGGDPLSKDQSARDKHGTGGPGYQFKDEINSDSYASLQRPLTEVMQPQQLSQLPPEAKEWTVADLYSMQGYNYDKSLESLPMQQGVLAMANSGPNTNGSQFFIITAQSTPHLEGKHTPFAIVREGMDVVAKISQVETDENDNPVEPVVIEDIVIGEIPQDPLKVE